MCNIHYFFKRISTNNKDNKMNELRNELITDTEKSTCEICMDVFNKSTRAKSECPYCHTNVCRTCFQTYLLSDISDVPRCVNTECGHGWERDFLDSQFTRTFRLTTYKEHREKVLADREKARLPATQEDAIAYKDAVMRSEKLTDSIREIENNINLLQIDLRAKRQELQKTCQTIGLHGRRSQEDVKKSQTVASTFIKPCPATDCRGFLSTAWKCGLCTLWTCPDCHELKGDARDSPHTCDPTKVATVALLEKEAKPCPKCGSLICKINGCDQMWCTQCNTAFNWKTGIIATGPIHNPHYFIWLQNQKETDGTAIGAVVGGGAAGGQCMDNYGVDRAIYNILGRLTRDRMHHIKNTDGSDLPDALYLSEIWRFMREAQDNEMREPDMEERFRELRVQYLCGDIMEDDWKTKLQRLEKDTIFTRSVRQIREVFIGATNDLIRQLISNKRATPLQITEIRNQVQKLVLYCNECYENISKRFGRKVPTIHFIVSVPKAPVGSRTLP